MMVQTVRGPIDPKQLGKTLMHEHIVFNYPGFEGDATIAPFNEQGSLDHTRTVITKVKAQGFDTIIDATPNDCGRNPEFLKKVSEQYDIQIICSTGYYFEGIGGSGYFKSRSLFADVVEELTELMVKEITVGIRDTGIKAGVIKLGTSANEITEYENWIIKAAVNAQKATGVPIITHTQSGTMGPEQAALLIALGADPRKTVIGHMCENVKDLKYQLDTLSYGVGIAYDRIGQHQWGNDITDDNRILMIMTMIEKGYGDRIFLSHDTVNNWIGRDTSALYKLPETKHWHIGRLGEYIVPKLMENGITEDQINQILVKNVANLWVD